MDSKTLLLLSVVGGGIGVAMYLSSGDSDPDSDDNLDPDPDDKISDLPPVETPIETPIETPDVDYSFDEFILPTPDKVLESSKDDTGPPPGYHPGQQNTGFSSNHISGMTAIDLSECVNKCDNDDACAGFISHPKGSGGDMYKCKFYNGQSSQSSSMVTRKGHDWYAKIKYDNSSTVS